MLREKLREKQGRAFRHGDCSHLPVLKWAIIFFVVSVIAGFLGFTGVASTTRTIAKVLFFIFLAIFLVVLVFGVFLGVLIFD